MNHLSKVFNHHFSVIPANNSSLVAQAHALRYQVYCVENEYEEPGYHPHGLETDEYDRHSIQSLVKHKETSSFIGTVRLILQDPANPDARFPAENFCKPSYKTANVEWDELPRSSLAEISRFAVSKCFKRRIGELNTAAGITENTITYLDTKTDRGERQTPYLVTMGLFASIVKMSAEQGITHWFALLEPALLRLLSRFGIELTYIGEPVEYHGYRQPCFAAIDDVLAIAYEKCREGWEMATENGTLWPAPRKTVNSQQRSENRTGIEAIEGVDPVPQLAC